MTEHAHLFSPITIRGTTIRNRIGVSPMCQYSSEDGFANDWHLQHIGSRAAGGAGVVIMEATGVTPEGRITPGCLGIWKDEHIPMLSKIAAFAKSQGAVIGIQIAHAGRKASMSVPWEKERLLGPSEGGWQTIAPSAIAFKDTYSTPKEMTLADIEKLKSDFVAAALRAVKAGFQLVELHGAHGYLFNEFISPFSNKRSDQYGGSEENRFRLIIEAAIAVRKAIPDSIILSTRLSCSDWQEGGITIDDSTRLAEKLKAVGVDIIDCSSAGVSAEAHVVTGPGYQVPFSDAIRKKTGVLTSAVGMITDAQQAQDIITGGQADFVFLARQMLRDPYFALHAAQKLGAAPATPKQYARAFPHVDSAKK